MPFPAWRYLTLTLCEAAWPPLLSLMAEVPWPGCGLQTRAALMAAPRGLLSSTSVLLQSLLGAGLLDLRAASVERNQTPGPSQRDGRNPGANVRLECDA